MSATSKRDGVVSKFVWWLLGASVTVILALLSLGVERMENRIDTLERRVNEHIRNDSQVEELREEIERHHP